jgi:Fe-S cluster biogenesis protein NfuA
LTTRVRGCYLRLSGRLGTAPRKEKGMKEKVEAALEQIRPHLQADGGNVELVDVTDGVVKVKLTGACGGCPMAAMTMQGGVARVIKQQVPEVKEVIAV